MLQIHQYGNAGVRSFEIFSEYPMLLSEREMNSELFFHESLYQRGGGGWYRGIQSKSEFPYTHFSLKLDDIIIYFLEIWREIRRGKNSSSFYRKEKWFNNSNRKIFSLKGIYIYLSWNAFQIDRLSKNLSKRECSSFIFNSSIVSCITANFLNRSKLKNFSVHSMWAHIFWASLRREENWFWRETYSGVRYVSEFAKVVCSLSGMYARWLYSTTWTQRWNSSNRIRKVESRKFVDWIRTTIDPLEVKGEHLDQLDLRIHFFCNYIFHRLMMIKSCFLILLEIMIGHYSILWFCIVIWINKSTTIEWLRRTL